MVLRDFIDYDVYRYINEKIKNKEPFEYDKEVKGSKNRVRLRIHSNFISKESADEIWKGIDYLVDMQVNYHGASGIGGWGYAVNHYENYESWDKFSDYIHGLLLTFSDYEREKKKEIFDQMSLWNL